MENVEEQILAYPHLSVEKQRDVEGYVEDHPEWAPLLRDVRAIEAIDRGVEAVNNPSSEPLLTTYVVVHHFYPDRDRGVVSPELDAALSRVERQLEEDQELQARADRLERQLEEAEAHLDPVTQFEALTGHSLAVGPSGQAAAAGTTAAVENPDRETESAGPVRSLFEELLRLPMALRWAGATLAVLFGTYVVLFVVSEASQSTLDRLATVRVSDQVVEGYSTAETRSAMPTRDTLTTDDLYLEALSALRGARTSTFGLFPRYDAEALSRVETHLRQVVERTDEESFLALEAQFYLGKVHLAQRRVEAARSRFETVVEEGGRNAKDARDILNTLEEEIPNGTVPANGER